MEHPVTPIESYDKSSFSLKRELLVLRWREGSPATTTRWVALEYCRELVVRPQLVPLH